MDDYKFGEDGKSITYSYKSSNSLEAVKMLVQTHIMQWGRSPEFLVVDEVTLAMIKANMFNIMGEEQYFDPANKFKKLMGMAIVSKDNSIIFTQDSITFVEKETEEDEPDEGTNT